MKTKAQKQNEIEKGKELAKNAEAVILVDFAKVRTKDLRNLRRELKNSGNPMLVIKKRLLGLILKEQGIDFQNSDFKTSTATIFASNLEQAAGMAYKFFGALQKEKKIEDMKLMGGYSLTAKTALSKEQILAIGKLPPREVLLAQLLGMLAAPIRSFLYVLSEKSKQTQN